MPGFDKRASTGSAQRQKTLTPALSHRMGEGDGSDAWDDSIAWECNKRNSSSLSRRMGEGRSEGFLILHIRLNDESLAGAQL